MDAAARSRLVRLLLEAKQRRNPRTERDIARRHARMAQPDMANNRRWDRPAMFDAAMRRGDEPERGVAPRRSRRRALSRRAEARERGY